jgi:hypothetical protein
VFLPEYVYFIGRAGGIKKEWVALLFFFFRFEHVESRK